MQHISHLPLPCEWRSAHCALWRYASNTTYITQCNKDYTRLHRHFAGAVGAVQYLGGAGVLHLLLEPAEGLEREVLHVLRDQEGVQLVQQVCRAQTVLVTQHGAYTQTHTEGEARK